MLARFQEELLDRHLQALLGEVEPFALELLHRHLEWVSLAGGQTLMAQGEPGDSMYLVISGRLRAYVRGEDGDERMVREMARGQVVGEMSLYTDEPRSASVVAIRDSVLVRLGKAAFSELLASSARISILLTRQIIHRLQNPQPRSDLARPVTITLLPISAGVDVAHICSLLAAQLALKARVCIVDAAGIDQALRQPGIASSEPGDLALDRRIGLHLDEIEAAHDYVLLLADDHPSAWTQRCCRRCDEVLLLADADQPPRLHESERECLMVRPGRTEASETLVLLHPAERRCPQGTRHWLERRPVSGHLHIRPALERDIARLARVQSGSAVGLVFGGGGARGCAHLGIVQALQEHGIEIDFVGGTSIGAVMAALVATDRPLPEVMAVARRSFSVNPTGDFNLLPMISLIAGRRLRRVVGAAAHELLGLDADVEDLWKTYFCVASNYSQASELVISRGNLLQGLLASIAIPGALPPVVHDGDLLCDGGTFNNFPVDVMRDMRSIGKVIGVDLSARKPRRIAHVDMPGAWALVRDRLRPRGQRRYRLPSLVSYLMNVTVLYSTSRERQARRLTDLYFNPPLERVGMLQWEKFDDIVAQGHAHGVAVLAALPEAAPPPGRTEDEQALGAA
ncbi:MAG: cyclic nucleotide-binding domain-containing protein [Rubrivivax sp.]|nr:cyclic nucleotide-binding domain-containing protein [Rubrivivax sp.]